MSVNGETIIYLVMKLTIRGNSFSRIGLLGPKCLRLNPDFDIYDLYDVRLIA